MSYVSHKNGSLGSAASVFIPKHILSDTKKIISPHLKIGDCLFVEEEVGRGRSFKKYFYRWIGMKNESMEQLNALKSCPFSPGAIWSEQHVMSVVKIHVYRCSFREIQNGAFSEWFQVKPRQIRKTQNLNPESFKRNFVGFKKLTLKN